MILAYASVLAKDVLGVLAPFCERVEVAGSIRRLRPEVNDIDIVAIPKGCECKTPFGMPMIYGPDETWKELIPRALKQRFSLEAVMGGRELLRFHFRANGVQVDLYRARPETWGIILLVRTGSKEHNVKLCRLALSKGLKLSAAEGVLKPFGVHVEILARKTEVEIFSALGLSYIRPEDREV